MQNIANNLVEDDQQVVYTPPVAPYSLLDPENFRLKRHTDGPFVRVNYSISRCYRYHR